MEEERLLAIGTALKIVPVEAGGTREAPCGPEPGERLTGAEIRSLKRQIMATFIDLPGVCPRRRCRRQGRCLMADAPCLALHEALARTRLAELLDWP